MTVFLRALAPSRPSRAAAALAIVLAVLAGACSKKQPPIARPTAPPPSTSTAAGSGSTSTTRPPAPPEPVRETPAPTETAVPDEGDLGSRSLDDLNRESPFQAVFFALDADTIDAAGQAVLSANAEIMKRYASWVVTVEGHCDERGTAEYNLALGERRALAARNYLVSLGIPGERLRTVSYGKEFPFDPGKTEEAYARNRRAHFVVTSK